MPVGLVLAWFRACTDIGKKKKKNLVETIKN